MLCRPSDLLDIFCVSFGFVLLGELLLHSQSDFRFPGV